MFVRKKKNISGSISVQIIQKISGKSKLIETIGCSKDIKEVEKLYKQAQDRVLELEPNLFSTSKKHDTNNFLKGVSNSQIKSIGDELIFGKLFDELKCHQVFESINDIRKKDEKIFLFKSLILSRILYQGSKLYLIDYLSYFKQKIIDKEVIYRFLDTIYKDELKLEIERCVFNYTNQKMNDSITFTFYDVTTLYFESESEDDLRRIGFSKEGKLARPQIQLGLFTTLEGHPLSFEVYEGNKYEGHTLVDILKKFQDKFQLPNRPVVVADRGMLNNDNLAYLENTGYKYILAAKIKNISNDLKKKITDLTFIDDGTIHVLEFTKDIAYRDDNEQKKTINIKQRLILSYSTQRAKKDKYNRDKAIEKLKQKINNSNNITKKDLKLSHYAKFLNLESGECNISFNLNSSKVEADSKLDGIKGFITNDFMLDANDVIKHYQNQYDVEKAFRISKTDLKIRPIYHRLENRIKAHILISFVAYAVYKEFDTKMKESEIAISRKLLIDIIKTFYAIKLDDKLHQLEFDEVQQQVYDAIYKKL